jgi:hypothetical protein
MTWISGQGPTAWEEPDPRGWTDAGINVGRAERWISGAAAPPPSPTDSAGGASGRFCCLSGRCSCAGR